MLDIFFKKKIDIDSELENVKNFIDQITDPVTGKFSSERYIASKRKYDFNLGGFTVFKGNFDNILSRINEINKQFNESLGYSIFNTNITKNNMIYKDKNVSSKLFEKSVYGYYNNFCIIESEKDIRLNYEGEKFKDLDVILRPFSSLEDFIDNYLNWLKSPDFKKRIENYFYNVLNNSYLSKYEKNQIKKILGI